MKQALVIGASGGIGAAMVKELEARGYAVTARSRRHDGLDVTDAAAVSRVMGALEGPFDLIFVAVGTLAAGRAPEKALKQVTPAQMARVMAVNAIGPALVLAHAERLLPRQGRSVVGVLSARVGSIGDNRMGGWYSYRASKAALNQLVHGAAIEIGRKRQEAVVAALHPGTVATGFTADYPGHDKVGPEVAAARLADVMERLGSAQSGGFYDYAGREIPW
ncbi:SDR family NAD(P)-dependent oxidoreductase [Lutimaribacter sp. EGI FJ00015]|uniref:SDR family NAD(P)-dependent oxidoreductase n=1 Tax=Lutimaribacter degradans TaxID=2945989 RepID=A0ACC5ZZM1_9RHOB|nr:SDR family NAD(P)-dependent oxidoreductase [Lutimaribacter sp. EGI FJ00013]MCM2563536.1 SDR family NAD(P)-dependent oxidoreductase [Lutimaribacter sp. EGI FJ00013]MCO0614716.1 SDR family NAD(P)-dependent oxidoreductase [Lutimaribacter sp. EGI FJ00015]MCO0637386.1 SDR family NAD(P)-dependent oxidoreductase [Lutimaribacter sp. EGI FJ00014]